MTYSNNMSHTYNNSMNNSSTSQSKNNHNNDSHMFDHYLKNKENLVQKVISNNNSIIKNQDYKMSENDSLIEMIAKKEVQNNKIISNLELVQDFGKTKQKCFGRNKSLNSIDIDINDINFLFDKK